MDKVMQLLGVAMRAGKIISGESLVLKEIRSQKARVVILAEDAAVNVEKKISDKCKSYHIPLLRYGRRDELGKAIGKDERVVLALLDEGFAKVLMERVIKR